MKANKKFLVFLATIMTIAMLLTGCNGAKPVVKDTLTVALGADAYTMDPAKHSVYPTATILFQIYDPLVIRDDKGQIKPWLAESWKNLDDNTWQFKLKQGVKFSNGEEFDAESVKFTIERVLDPKTKAPYRTRVAIIDKVQVVDKYTVNIITKKPYPTMLQSLAEDSFGVLMVPPKYVKEKGEDILATKPVGTGPYKLLEWVKDDHVTLEARDDYWAGNAKIKKVVFRPIPEVSTRISELKSGGVDIAGDIPPEMITELETNPKTRVEVVPSDRLFFVVMNTLEGGPLANKKVRQALNYAVDVDAINKNILGGKAQRIAVSLGKNAFGYDDSIQPYPYDPQKAKQLLTEAGYPDGFKIPFISR